MFAKLGAENSRRVLSSIASGTGVELPPDWFVFDWEVDASSVLLALFFLMRASEFSTQFVGRLKWIMHYPI
jgi:hypothetical protein